MISSALQASGTGTINITLKSFVKAVFAVTSSEDSKINASVFKGVPIDDAIVKINVYTFHLNKSLSGNGNVNGAGFIVFGLGESDFKSDRSRGSSGVVRFNGNN